MGGIDANEKHFVNTFPVETHGFYKLAQSYDDQAAINQIIEQTRVEELRGQVENMSLTEKNKPLFKKKHMNNLAKQMARLSISQADL